MNNVHSRARLSKERAFLFLSILITLVLLAGFPDHLRIFVLGTAGTITGGATAVGPAEMKDYFMGLAIFAALLVFLAYLVHSLRTPKPESWYPHQIDGVDEEEPSTDFKKDLPLENKLEQVNKVLKKLRTEKETAPAKKNKKITTVPNIEEIHLEHTLRKINAQLHGYKKPPLILEIPKKKTEWDESLEEVKQELKKVDKMKVKKARVLREAPSLRDIALKLENKKLQEDLKRILSKQEKVTVLEEPLAKKQWNIYMEKVNQDLEEIDRMPIKKVKIRTEAPLMTKESHAREQKLLAGELQKLHNALGKEQQKTTADFAKRHLRKSSIMKDNK